MGVVAYIGAYHLLGTYYLSTYCYKHMALCLLTRFYGITFDSCLLFVSLQLDEDLLTEMSHTSLVEILYFSSSILINV